jgi:hypothetical protein
MRPTVTAVDSIIYTAQDGTETTLSGAAYTLANASDYRALVLPAYGTVWPVARCQPESVQIIFSSGYADADFVPEPIKAWIKLRVGALYENREAWTAGGAIARNEFLDHLLDRYKTWAW